MKSLKSAGNINAAHEAFIFDKSGNQIGVCMDTPNNCAFAFTLNQNAHTIKTPFNGVYTRERLKGHYTGLDADYHAKYISFNPTPSHHITGYGVPLFNNL
jgi:hypothetical protein